MGSHVTLSIAELPETIECKVKRRIEEVNKHRDIAYLPRKTRVDIRSCFHCPSLRGVVPEFKGSRNFFLICEKKGNSLPPNASKERKLYAVLGGDTDGLLLEIRGGMIPIIVE